MKDKKRSKKNSKLARFVIGSALVIFAFYAVVTLVNQQIEISEKKEELNALNGEITIQEIKNEDIKQVYNLDDNENDAYIERVAREEFDYSKQGERVFINIAGE